MVEMIDVIIYNLSDALSLCINLVHCVIRGSMPFSASHIMRFEKLQTLRVENLYDDFYSSRIQAPLLHIVIHVDVSWNELMKDSLGTDDRESDLKSLHLDFYCHGHRH